MSATGFALASARLLDDDDAFTALYRTVDLFGLPTSDDVRDRRTDRQCTPARAPDVGTGGRAVIWRELKPFVGLTIVVAVYAIVRFVFTSLADDQGILTPGDHVDTTLVVLGISTLVLRFVVLVIVPVVLIYRLVMRVARRWTDP